MDQESKRNGCVLTRIVEQAALATRIAAGIRSFACAASLSATAPASQPLYKEALLC